MEVAGLPRSDEKHLLRGSSPVVPAKTKIESPWIRQLEKEAFGSPATRARQPILNAKLNFLSLFHEAERQKRAFLHFDFSFLMFSFVISIAFPLIKATEIFL